MQEEQELSFNLSSFWQQQELKYDLNKTNIKFTQFIQVFISHRIELIYR